MVKSNYNWRVRKGELLLKIMKLLFNAKDKKSKKNIILLSNDGMNFPKNQCTNCGAWVDEDYKEEHEAHCVSIPIVKIIYFDDVKVTVEGNLTITGLVEHKKVISSNNNLEKRTNI